MQHKCVMEGAELTPKDAFAAFGQAVAKVQALEHLMRLALGEEEVRKATRKGEGLDPKLGARMLKFDFGKLEQRICGKFKLTRVDRQIMSDARDLRNSLAHSFWIGHQGHLATQRGIETIIREANLHSRQMDRIADLVIRLTGVNSRQYSDYVRMVANSPETLETWDRMLAHTEDVFNRTEPSAVISPTEAAGPRAERTGD